MPTAFTRFYVSSAGFTLDAANLQLTPEQQKTADIYAEATRLFEQAVGSSGDKLNGQACSAFVATNAKTCNRWKPADAPFVRWLAKVGKLLRRKCQLLQIRAEDCEGLGQLDEAWEFYRAEIHLAASFRQYGPSWTCGDTARRPISRCRVGRLVRGRPLSESGLP